MRSKTEKRKVAAKDFLLNFYKDKIGVMQINRLEIDFLTGEIIKTVLPVNIEVFSKDEVLAKRFKDQIKSNTLDKVASFNMGHITLKMDCKKYIEYTETDCPMVIKEHERMHLINALGRRYSRGDKELKSEMIIDFMAVLRTSKIRQQSFIEALDEYIQFMQKFSHKVKSVRYRLEFMYDAKHIVETFNKIKE